MISRKDSENGDTGRRFMIRNPEYVQPARVKDAYRRGAEDAKNECIVPASYLRFMKAADITHAIKNKYPDYLSICRSG
jgi:hypothetical protein